MDDYELLREYDESRSERAFAGLVAQHLPHVYGTALRVLRDPAAAEDVAQMVFIQLSRKAWLVRAGALPGWLYRATLRTALNHQRGEHRRRQRETEAMNLTEQNHDSAAAWEKLAPLLDEALGQLHRVEQDALLLRYFKGCSMNETGRLLSLSKAAAQKRVSRALEKMRLYFAREGMIASAALLSATLGTHAAEPPPAGLAGRINANSLAATTGSAGITHLLWRILSMTTKTKLLVLAALVAAVAVIALKTSFFLTEKNPAPITAPRASPAPFIAPTPPSSAPLPAPEPRQTVATTPTAPPPAQSSLPVPNASVQSNPATMITDILKLIHSNDYVTLFTKYTPPSVIQPLLKNIPPQDQAQFVQKIVQKMISDPGFTDVFNLYAAVLESKGIAPPVYLDNLAIFKDVTFPGNQADNVYFVNENGLWYLPISATVDPATGKVKEMVFSSSVPSDWK